MTSELSVIEQLKALNTQLGQTLSDQEKLRRTLRDEVLKLAWKIGVPQDDKPVLEAADLTLEHLVRTVGRWVDGAIERQREKREQALWMEAVVPQLMAEVECMLRNDGQGERYDEREWRLARGEVQRLVQQLRDAGVVEMTMREAQEAAKAGQPLVQRITYTAVSLAVGDKSGGAAAELLAACKAVVKECNLVEYDGEPPTVEMAADTLDVVRAAIAKAEEGAA